MLEKEILDKIESDEITSRGQVYKIVGRSKKLRLWLDENNLLMPKQWNKDAVAVRMRDLFESLGRIPLARDDWSLAGRAQQHYGSWNNAVFAVFGEYNQRRYAEYSDAELLDFIKQYIIKYQLIPAREIFDGKRYPYFETYFHRFNKRNWSQVIGLIDLTGVKYFTQKHGWGKKYISNGIVYLSLQEKLIGDWLFSQGIKFEKEVPYENSNHIFDFYLPEFNVYIEYYGIKTDDYEGRIEDKRSKYNGRKVIEIFKHDNTIGKLAAEVQRL